MMKRCAVVGLAFAGLAASATALSAAPTQDPTIDVTTDEVEASSPVVRMRAPKARPRLVSVLPPLRPAFPAEGESAAAATALPSEAATTAEIRVSVPDVPALAVASATDAPPAADEGAPRGKVVTILPPLRPTADEPATIEASAEDAAPARSVVVALLPPARPGFRSDARMAAEAPAEPVAAPAAPAEPPRSFFSSLFNAPAVAATAVAGAGSTLVGAGESVVTASRATLNRLISVRARENDVPEDLVHRVVVRESKYNPRAVGLGGAMGLMQIKHATARAMGYTGPASGLLDADTNLTYAVKYLAGAYRTANGNYDQAVRYYARGYYYAAKAQRVRYASGSTRDRRKMREADASAAAEAASR